MTTKAKPWTKEEISRIKAYISMNSDDIKHLSTVFGRSYDSVDHQRRRLGIKLVNMIESTSFDAEQIFKPKEWDKIIIASLKEELLRDLKQKESYPKFTIQKKSTGDTLVIQLTDLHAGKIVKNQEGEIIYNENVFRTRINCLCEQTLKLLDNNISKGTPINDVVILLTGDLANGEGIYATQAYEQEIAPPRQVMLVVDVITKLTVSLLNRGLFVKVYGVRGNHGRTGKDTDVASNWDLMIYEILSFWQQFVLKSSKLQIKFAETEHMVINIRNHGFMLRHIAPEQGDAPGGRVKFNEWARMYKLSGIVYGHWHHAGVFDVDNVRVFRGGSTVGGDSLSDSMAKHSEPIQLIWGVNEHRVSTFIYFVDLGKK